MKSTATATVACEEEKIYDDVFSFSFSISFSPPCVVWDRIPSILLVAFKKWRAWSKAWKPTTSAHVIDFA